MEAVGSSKMITTYKSTQCHKPGGELKVKAAGSSGRLMTTCETTHTITPKTTVFLTCFSKCKP
jgi:hypothetical protein